MSLSLYLRPRISDPWFVLWSPFFKVTLYLYKSTTRSCMKYYCHALGGAPNCHLDMLDNLQKWICGTVRPELTAFLEDLFHRRNMTSLSHFYRYYLGRWLSELAEFFPLPYSRGISTRYSIRFYDFSITIPRCYKDVYINNFFLRTAWPWIICLQKAFLWPII